LVAVRRRFGESRPHIDFGDKKMYFIHTVNEEEKKK